jgi:hypothetical protein
VQTTEGELRFETVWRDRVVRATFFVSIFFFGVFDKKNEMKIKGARWKK